jgi:SNF2 family DNA or RNA helicase
MLDEEGIEYLYLDGAINQQNRQQLIDKYQSGQSPEEILELLK